MAPFRKSKAGDSDSDSEDVLCLPPGFEDHIVCPDAL
jgi:hypothetical protein